MTTQPASENPEGSAQPDAAPEPVVEIIRHFGGNVEGDPQ